MADKTLTLSFAKNFNTSLVFVLATDGDLYYLIDCYQSFLGNCFFVFYWFLPVKLFRLSREEAEKLKWNGVPVMDKEKSSAKWFGGTASASILGRVIYSVLKPIDVVEGNPQLWFVAALVVVSCLRSYHRYRLYQALPLNRDEFTEVRLKPKKFTWQTVKGLLAIMVLVIILGGLFMIRPALISWLVLLAALLVYSLQSKFAFAHGDYSVVFEGENRL